MTQNSEIRYTLDTREFRVLQYVIFQWEYSWLCPSGFETSESSESTAMYRSQSISEDKFNQRSQNQCHLTEMLFLLPGLQCIGLIKTSWLVAEWSESDYFNCQSCWLTAK